MSSQTETQPQPQPQQHTQPQIIEEDDMPELEKPYLPPTKPYYLSQTIRPLEEICGVTNNFTYMSEEFKRVLFFRIGNRNWPTTFGMFNAPTYLDTIKKIIGVDGHFLKLTTRNCDVDMIWHDRRNNMFVFWGPSIYTVVQAMNHIRSRIIKYTVYVYPDQARIHAEQMRAQSQQYEIEEITDDEDNAMPDLVDYDGNIVN
jgi:hypothetical protein